MLLTAFAALMLVAAAAMLLRGRRATLPPRPRGDASPEAATRPAASVAQGSGARAASPSLERPGRRAPRRARCLVAAHTLHRLPGSSRWSLAATVVGLLTGFFGVGGGFVIVPALVLALGFDMPVAVGTSLLVIAINSAVALPRGSAPTHLDWPLLAVFTGGAIAGSFAGNRVASQVDAARLTVAFTVLLVCVAAYTAFRSIPHLV